MLSNDGRRPLANNGDALGNWIVDVVAIAQLQAKGLALYRGPVADAIDIEVLGETLGYAGHHVLQAGPGGSPHAVRGLGFVGRRDFELAI